MIATDLVGLVRLGHAYVGITDDRQVIPERFQRAQSSRSQVEVAPYPGRCPKVLRCTPLVAARSPMNHLDRYQTGGVVRSRRRGPDTSGRHHSVEQRERHRRAHPAKERATGKVFARDELHV